MTILFVSHKLEDVEVLCDTVAVLRKGALVGTMGLPFQTKAIVELMFGKDVPLAPKTQREPGKNVLNAKKVADQTVR